jgi:PII-like signaling protein
MKTEAEQTLLRVYLRNTDKQGWLGRPTAEALIEEARTQKLAGGVLLRGICGLDVSGHLLESSSWSIVEHVPVIVEFIDRPERIGAFLPTLEKFVADGVATLERAHVMLYRRQSAIEHVPQSAMSRKSPASITPLSTLPSAEEFPIMQLSEKGQLLRVFIGESDERDNMPLYRAIVLKARELGLAGATVLRGPMGFGANSNLHTSKILELSTDLPIIIEIVDSPQKIQTLLPFLDEAVLEGLITLEDVAVFRYRHNEAKLANRQ